MIRDHRDKAWEIDTVAGIMVTVFFLLYMMLFAPVLSHFFSHGEMPVDPKLAWEFGRSSFGNENVEKLIYVVFTVSFPFFTVPLLLLVRSKLMHGMQHRLVQAGGRVLTGLALVAVAGMIVYWNRPFVICSIYKSHYLYFIVSTLALTYFAHKEFRLSRSQLSYRMYAYVAGALLLVFAMVIASNSTAAISDVRLQLHFMSYFRSIVQSYLGKTIFVDTESSYGAYSLILLPLFKIAGLRLFTFAFVMIALSCVSFGCLFLFLRSITNSYTLSIMSLGSAIWYGCVWNNSVLDFDRFFQTVPHRLLIPAVMVWLIWRYQKQTSKRIRKIQYYLIGLFAGFGVLWSPEIGVITLFSWFIFLFLDTIVADYRNGFITITRSVVIHFVRQILLLALVFIAFSAIIYLRSGKIINLVYELFYFPFLISVYGIDARPVSTDSWQFTILIYIVGFLYGTTSLLFHRQADQKQALMLIYLSVLGTGIFSYFMGHSEVFSLAHVSWPCFLILAIIGRDLIAGLGKKETLTYKNCLITCSAVLICFVIGSGLLNMTHWDTFKKQREDSERINGKHGINYEKAVKRMEKLPALMHRLEGGAEVLIISNAAPIYHLYTQTTSPVDIFSKKDVNDYVKGGGWSQMIIDNSEPPFNWDDAFTREICDEVRRESKIIIERSNLQFCFK